MLKLQASLDVNMSGVTWRHMASHSVSVVPTSEHPGIDPRLVQLWIQCSTLVR